MARAAKGRGPVQALAALAVLTPLLVMIAAIGVRTGLLSMETGHDLLAWRIGWWLAFVSAGAGVLAFLLSIRDLKRLGLIGLVALIAGGGALGGYLWQKSRLDAGPGENVSTDLADVPGFGEFRSDAGGGPAVGGAACPGARPVMTQVAPEGAAWALQEAGFSLGRTGVSRADGTHRGFWFGVTHDAVIRIRPGRTDIRVAARDGRSHGGAACRLATKLSTLLTPES